MNASDLGDNFSNNISIMNNMQEETATLLTTFYLPVNSSLAIDHNLLRNSNYSSNLVTLSLSRKFYNAQTILITIV